MSIFSERLQELRKMADLSQKEFGQRIGASRDQISNWEQGRGEPDTQTIKDIASSCGVSISWLLGETDIRFKFNATQIETILGLLLNEMDVISFNGDKKSAAEEFKKASLDEQKAILEEVMLKLNDLSLEEQKVIRDELNKLISSE